MENSDKSPWLRSQWVIGEKALEKVQNKIVLIFGVGGVGGAALEGLARLGIKRFMIVDGDVFDITNLNRQLLATESNLGQSKAEEAKKRVLSISSKAIVTSFPIFYKEENRGEIPFEDADIVLDCIDDVRAKIDIALTCQRLGIPLISALGCGNRLDPSALKACDIFETSNDPLAKVIRKRCREDGIKKLRVICSSELPAPKEKGEAIGSLPFVPNAAGLLMAYEAYKELSK